MRKQSLISAFHNATIPTSVSGVIDLAGIPFYENLFLDAVETSGFKFLNNQHILEINTPVVIIHADDDEVQYNPGFLGPGISGEPPITVRLLRSQIFIGFINTKLT